MEALSQEGRVLILSDRVNNVTEWSVPCIRHGGHHVPLKWTSAVKSLAATSIPRALSTERSYAYLTRALEAILPGNRLPGHFVHDNTMQVTVYLHYAAVQTTALVRSTL